MKQIFITLFFVVHLLTSWAHGGEDHGEKKEAGASSAKYFSAEALSDKYEVLVKYGELQANKEATLQLFLSDAATNRAIDAASISIKLVGHPKSNFVLARKDSGVYQVTGTFPDNALYDLQVNISGAKGADFLQVPKIEIGKKLAETEATEHSHWYSNPWLWAFIGLALGLTAMYFLMRNRSKKAPVTFLLLCMILPVSGINKIAAHGGEDHGAGGAKSGGLSNAYIVEKETQFLFDILTEKTGGGNFYESKELFGTVIASPQGLAVIQSPQTGKIISLHVTPGQTVAKGQTLALIEQQVEAGTQIDIISQRNSLNAEVKAAKAQYDRLLSIADIAAKKDVTEAKARYEAALQNYRLFNANIGGGASTKTVSLRSPISGVVGTFNYAIGAVVSSGQTLFEVTNLNRIYIETQVFASDNDAAGKNGRFEALASSDTTRFALRMLSTAQAVNTENQSQKMIFEVVNPAGKFKIGENVRVLQYSGSRIAQLVVPTAAIVDVSGKPAVFIKDKAEQYSISFIQKGESNPLYTTIIKGVEGGERVVTGNVYQMKMIYLGQ